MAGDEVTRDEFNKLVATINQVSIDIAIIKTKLETWPQPEPRPCPYFQALQKEFMTHLAEAQEQKGNWKRAITSSLVHISEMGVIGLIMYWIATALKSSGGPHLP